jgi:hypothetical protein
LTFRKLPLHRFGDYKGTLNRWLSQIPTEQFFVGFFEDILKHPKTLLYNVFKHIGVSCDTGWKLLRYNEAIIPPSGLKYRGHDTGKGVIDPEHDNSIPLLLNKL